MDHKSSSWLSKRWSTKDLSFQASLLYLASSNWRKDNSSQRSWYCEGAMVTVSSYASSPFAASSSMVLHHPQLPLHLLLIHAIPWHVRIALVPLDQAELWVSSDRPISECALDAPHLKEMGNEKWERKSPWRRILSTSLNHPILELVHLV